MHEDNLYKGFEVELFTGTYKSHVGISDEVEKNFSNFVKEFVRAVFHVVYIKMDSLGVDPSYPHIWVELWSQRNINHL